MSEKQAYEKYIESYRQKIDEQAPQIAKDAGMAEDEARRLMEWIAKGKAAEQFLADRMA